MAREEMDNGQYQPAVAKARAIASTQQDQIGVMQEMLASQ